MESGSHNSDSISMPVCIQMVSVEFCRVIKHSFSKENMVVKLLVGSVSKVEILDIDCLALFSICTDQ